MYVASYYQGWLCGFRLPRWSFVQCLGFRASHVAYQMNFPMVWGLIQIQTLSYRQYGWNRLRNGKIYDSARQFHIAMVSMPEFISL